MEDSRSPESRPILQRSEKVTEAFIECKSREKSGHWITHIFCISGFREVKSEAFVARLTKL
jgi:hypothetical protein